MLFDDDKFNRDFDKFDRNFNRMAKVGIGFSIVTMIGGLALVGVVIYVLIRWAGTF